MLVVHFTKNDMNWEAGMEKKFVKLTSKLEKNYWPTIHLVNLNL